MCPPERKSDVDPAEREPSAGSGTLPGAHRSDYSILVHAFDFAERSTASTMLIERAPSSKVGKPTCFSPRIAAYESATKAANASPQPCVWPGGRIVSRRCSSEY